MPEQDLQLQKRNDLAANNFYADFWITDFDLRNKIEPILLLCRNYPWLCFMLFLGVAQLTSVAMPFFA